MNGETSQYFTPAEFMILLELAGGEDCSLLGNGTTPETEALTTAFTSLFQRGLIQKSGDRFILSRTGTLFAHIRNAPLAVYMFSASGKISLCYAEEETFWLTELADTILSTQYRIRQLDRSGLEQWLFDCGQLKVPVLTLEDVQEWEALLPKSLDTERIPIQTIFRLEKHINGGPIIEIYTVYKYRGRWRIRWDEGKQDLYYTKEALLYMLTSCFGKGKYDCC